MSTEEPLPPILDLSSLDAKKKTFRTLVQATIVLMLASVLSTIVFPLPDALQIATDFEAELVPPFRTYATGFAVLGLIGVWLWGIVDLWHFRAIGLTKVAIAAFFPLFLIDNTATASNAVGDYVGTLGSIVDGMLLFMGWSNPHIFVSDNGGSVPQVNSQATSARETT